MHLGSVNSSEELSGESGDESGIERARTASSLLVRGFTADELDQRSVSYTQLVANKSTNIMLLLITLTKY